MEKNIQLIKQKGLLKNTMSYNERVLYLIEEQETEEWLMEEING